jgi:hypothetical protein
MPLVIKGSLGAWLQADSSISIDQDGLITGSASIDGDRASVIGSQPTIGQTRHPKDTRAVCTDFKLTYSKGGKAKIDANYFGIISDPTPIRIEFPGGSGQDPIETHPNFLQFAGTPQAPLNGAIFDDEDGRFLGFGEGEFAGVTSYIIPNVIVNVSYYTYRLPNVDGVGKIAREVLPFTRPKGVRNWLLIGMPYRQIGSFFYVTQQLLGSGPGGWNNRIY